MKKFTVQNMLRWFAFSCWIKKQPRDRIHFLDEVHFEPKSLRRRRGVAPSGSKIIYVNDEFVSERYSMILLTHHDQTKPPCSFRVCATTTNSVQFLAFLFDCLRSGRLRSGDTLIMDNAATHFTKDLFEPMCAMLRGAGVELKFLPTYSPELNPCELVFGRIKNWMRSHRGGGSSLFEEILLALRKVNHTHTKAFYKHCIEHARVL